MNVTPEIVLDNEPFSGTAFKNNGIIDDPASVLKAMISGGELQGWYGYEGGVEVAGDFELSAPPRKTKSGKFIKSFGKGQRVSGRAVKSLVDSGLVRIPARDGINNRLAIAQLLDAPPPTTTVQ